ncbi:lipid A export permease/ATP-binding protein MsbA [Rubrivivax sp. JA1026]|uniref:lipid A export permease/ATP-binding protein MsbA n=1 Tax=Rubrivivax sp. JA1026 TaxID=2710888 RepID=UPI0013E99E66|nr:lipid A export permease/ATP-binding protein MsbA [Rubrivivax sp. JA1026]
MKPDNSFALYRRLLQYVRPYTKVFVLGVLAMVVNAAAEASVPALLKQLIDGSFVEKDPKLAHVMPLALVALFAVRGLSDYAHTVALNSVATHVVLDLRNAVFARLLTLPLAFFDRQPSAVLMARLTHNAQQVNPIITISLITIVKDSLTVVGLLGYMLWLNWKLSLLFFTVLPVIGWVIHSVGRRLRRYSHAQQDSVGALSHVADEVLGAQREIKVFGGQAYEQRRFAEVAGLLRRYTMKSVRTSAANSPLVQLIASLALAGIIYYATLASQSNDLTVGGFVSFFGAMALLLGPLKRLSNVNETLQRGLAAAASLFEVLDAEPERDEGTRTLGRVSGHLRFEDVVFRYPNTEGNAIDRVTMEIAAGESVALVGASGSGKSTLMSLIPRFYAPDGGRILLDGVDTSEVRLADLRANIALVTQHVVLFNDTVAANIAYGAPGEPTREDIERAAETAHAMEFIRELPQGLDTQIGENGARLSGGQRQRLSIARALLKDAPILLLDEATSALDTESERIVQQAIDNLKRGRTTVTIAHRLSTIANADRVIVMDQGRVAEVGTHDELLARGGLYHKLHLMQHRQSEISE